MVSIIYKVTPEDGRMDGFSYFKGATAYLFKMSNMCCPCNLELLFLDLVQETHLSAFSRELRSLQHLLSAYYVLVPCAKWGDVVISEKTDKNLCLQGDILVEKTDTKQGK